MTKKKSKIPSFKSYKEEAEFWDTHDITNFHNETEDVEILFDMNQPRTDTLVIRLQKQLKEKLIKTAKAKGIDASTLTRMWIVEKLTASSP